MSDITIYYIDDDIEDRELFEYAVESLNKNITLRSFDSGVNFLKSIAEPDAGAVVFLDINLPIKSGFEILSEIRSTQALEHLPVIMYSTSNNPNSIQTSKLLGASLYAIKPTSIEELRGIVDKVIQIDWKDFQPESSEYIVR